MSAIAGHNHHDLYLRPTALLGQPLPLRHHLQRARVQEGPDCERCRRALVILCRHGVGGCQCFRRLCHGLHDTRPHRPEYGRSAEPPHQKCPRLHMFGHGSDVARPVRQPVQQSLDAEAAPVSPLEVVVRSRGVGHRLAEDMGSDVRAATAAIRPSPEPREHFPVSHDDVCCNFSGARIPTGIAASAGITRHISMIGPDTPGHQS